MAKAKAVPVSIIDIDDLRDLIEPARAIANALGSIDEECGLNHDSLWRLGNEINVKLSQALALLDRFDKQVSRAA